jgi:hypothetical protein
MGDGMPLRGEQTVLEPPFNSAVLRVMKRSSGGRQQTQAISPNFKPPSGSRSAC